VIVRHDWNLILMLDLRRFGRRSEPTKFQTPCFWCVWCAKLGHKFLVTSFWYQKLGPRTWVVCHGP